MLIAQGALEKSINDYSPSQYLENEIIQGLQQSLGKKSKYYSRENRNSE